MFTILSLIWSKVVLTLEFFSEPSIFDFHRRKTFPVKIFMVFIAFWLLQKDEILHVILEGMIIIWSRLPFGSTVRIRIQKLVPKFNSVLNRFSEVNS